MYTAPVRDEVDGLRIVHQRVISLMDSLCHLSLCHYHMEPLCHHTWSEDCTAASNFTHGTTMPFVIMPFSLIESLCHLRIVHQRVISLMESLCHLSLCHFLSQNHYAITHEITTPFVTMPFSLIDSLCHSRIVHQRVISLMEPLCHLSLCHFHSSNHYAI